MARRRPFASVRARTTLATTVVVSLALVAAGIVVAAVLRHDLADRAGLRAEVAARTVAGSQAALEGDFGALDLRGDAEHPVQVVDGAGGVVAAGPGVPAHRAVVVTGPAPRSSTPPEEPDDDRDDVPDRGKVGTGTELRTVTLRDGGETRTFRFAAVAGTTYEGRAYTVYAGSSLDEERATLDQVVRAMLIGLPFLLAVVAGVTWLGTGRALRPVEDIRAEMAEITGSGDLDRRVPEPDARDEVARLARTTNETLAALQRSVERRHRFVADASHELRSPIASLRTQIEVAQQHPDLLDLPDLLHDVVRLQHLAADLLLLARLDAGEPAARARVDLTGLVREATEAVEGPEGAAGPVAVVVRVPDGPVEVRGHRGRLARVLDNLLDNARRHAASRITVELRAEGPDAVLTVTDDGHGVAPGDRERIFERFVRLDEARGRDEGGAGLGLSIARDLAERHGGTLTAGAGADGGAAFRLTLPRADDRTD
ncbi:ATP-binding protein [Streptomyces termitum]|uniref:histidine kinase n=1 Tax=Streptomyces termitum TaxID=67368 RepID=A0A918W418_9ACTN|nr:HAMP domain-containing sensor histidine kinase [Streptomyces termitum]GHA65414.1 two-component sensor histidine kinase [Streptomyces termitum]